MSTATQDWQIALIGSFSGGEGVTAGHYLFDLKNMKTGEVNYMHINGEGVGLSLFPIAASWSPNARLELVRSRFPVTFEDIDWNGVELITYQVGDSTIGISGMDLRISDFNLMPPAGGVLPPLMTVKLRSTSFPVLSEEGGKGSPNVSADKHFGKLRIYRKPQVIKKVFPSIIVPPPVPKAPLRIKPIRVVLKSETLFEFDSHRVKDASALHELLLELQMRTSPHVVITGHTDSKGSDRYNLLLGQRRANTVKEWFVRHKAPKAMSYLVFSAGEAHPIADNETAGGRAKNRRVEITIS